MFVSPNSTTKIKVQPHQNKVIRYYLQTSSKGLIVYHSVGSGKTITALMTAKALYKKFKMPSVIVCPSSVLPGFTEEIEKVFRKEYSFVQIFTPITFIQQLTKNPQFTVGKLLIVDEAHNFRTNDGKITTQMITACRLAAKVMLLTGTPVHNDPRDIVPMLYMLQPANTITDLDTFNTVFEQALNKFETKNRKNDLVKIMQQHVSCYTNDAVSKSMYPHVERQEVKLIMDKVYLQDYKMVESNDKTGLPRYMKGKNISVFFNGLRRASNTLRAPSAKIAKVIDLIVSHKSEKCVIYSSWKDAGISLVGRQLQRLNIKHVYISGEQSQIDKKLNIDAYNNGDVQVMLISKAGAEGIDLKGTKVVIILEPHWNNELIRQVIGRAVRYRSHEHLPQEERVVRVYDIILKKPHSYIGVLLEQIGLYKTDDVPSVDELIKAYADRKDSRIQRFNKVLKHCSIEVSDKLL